MKQKVQGGGEVRRDIRASQTAHFRLSWTSLQDYEKTDGGEESCFLTFRFEYNHSPKSKMGLITSCWCIKIFQLGPFGGDCLRNQPNVISKTALGAAVSYHAIETTTIKRRSQLKQGKPSPLRIFLHFRAVKANFCNRRPGLISCANTAPSAIIYSTKAFPRVTQCMNRKRKRDIPTPPVKHLGMAQYSICGRIT